MSVRLRRVLPEYVASDGRVYGCHRNGGRYADEQRQKPAHVLRTNVTDRTFIRKQRDLLHDVDEVLLNIRQWLSSHSQNRGWKEPWPDAKDYPL